MKNIQIKLLSLGALFIGITACNNDFLEKHPTAAITGGDLEKNAVWNPNILLGQVAGISSTTFASGTGGTSDHDDFGQKSIDIATDLMSGDMVMGGETYGWFSRDSKLLNSTRTRNRAYQIWRYYFQIIKASNTIFDVVGGDSKMPDMGMQNRIYFGQAKVLRAYAYYNLVNLYAKAYNESQDTPVLPIYKNQLTAETEALSTVKEVYDLIIADLQDALIALEGYSRSTIDQPNLALANAFLAYVYMAKGDYANAAKYSLEVINSKEFKILPLNELTTNGFNSVDNKNWIWGINLTKDNTAKLSTFWGHVDYFTYSYAAAGDYKMIPDNLLAEIPSTDGRQGWFSPSPPQMPLNKFFDNARKPLGDRLWENDEVYLRVEEMYLINAEANVRNNKLSDGVNSLKALLDERDKVVAESLGSMSQNDLLELIYLNWRVETWGEGRGLLTMKRFKKSVTRGTNDFAFPGETFSYDDSRFVFAIPEAEILNNPNLE